MKKKKIIKILIVSSEKMSANSYASVLNQNGYNAAKIITNSEEAAEFAQNSPIDIVIINDIINGEVDSIALSNKIISTYHLPIIYITSNEHLSYTKNILKSLSVNYLIKPVLKDILIFTIKNSLLQQKLTQKSKTYLTLFNSIADPILIFEKSTLKIIDCNRAFLNKYGYTKPELREMTPYNLHPEYEYDLVKSRINTINKGNYFEYHHITKSGKIFNVAITSNKIKFKNKSAYISIIHDITAREKYEKEIKKHATQSEIFFNIGKKLSQNLQLDRLFKDTVEIIKKSFKYYGVLLLVFDGMNNLILKEISGTYSDIFPANMKIHNGKGIIGKAAKTKKTILCKNISKNKDYIKLSNEETKSELAVPIISNNNVLGIIDIQSNELNAFSEEDAKVIETVGSQVAIALENANLYKSLQDELKQKEISGNDLRIAHQEMDKIFNTTIDGIMVIDKQFTIYKINDSLKNLLNLPAYKTTGIKCYSALKSSVCNTLECPVYQINEQNSKYTKSNVIIHAPGKDIHCTISSSSFYSKDGHLKGIVSSIHDLTEYMEIQTKLLQSQKLQSIGQLAAGIAHEINTPAQYVGDNIEFFKDSFKGISKLIGETDALCKNIKSGNDFNGLLDAIEQTKSEIGLDFLLEEIPTAIDQTIEGVNRISKIVSAMKDFSHPGETTKTLADINRAIKTTVTIARNKWKYVADIDLELDETIPPVPCYVDEFNQVILNLIVNAADSITEKIGASEEKKGKITIVTKRSGNFIEILVQDTGQGIPESIQGKIFDPFFTTKEVGKGTGQGLSICYSVIVDKHNGTLSCESKPRIGALFTIKLPLDQG